MKNWMKVTLLVLGVGAIGATVYYFVKSTKGNELLAYVPNNAGLLVKFNLPEIGKALEGHQEEIKNFAFLKDKDLKNSDPLLKTLVNLLKDPKKSGLDFGSPAFLFTEGRPRGSATGFIIKLSEPDLFAGYIRKNIPAGNQSGKENDIEYAEFAIGIYISWNSSVALITDQKTENKSYFTDILNKRNPGAKGNILLSKISAQEGMVSGIFRIDELMSSHELKTRIPAVIDGVKSPFPPGTAVVANILWENGEIRTRATLTSLNEDKIKDIQIFKKAGVLGEHEKNMFGANLPFMALSMSFDIPKLFSFIEHASPEFKEMRKSNEKFKKFESILNGDIVLGLAADEDVLKRQKAALETRDYENYPSEYPYKLIIYLGTKSNATGLINETAPWLQPNADGIYLANAAFYVSAFTIEDHQITISNNLETLHELKKKTFKQPTTDFAFHPEKNAPFYVDMNMEAMQKISAAQSSKTNTSFENYMKLFSNSQYGYVKDGELVYIVGMKDKKTYPILTFLRFIETVYKEDQKKKEELNQDVEVPLGQLEEGDI